ncbi:MAG: YIP1 family protein [Clostridium sp.]
MFCSKCGANLQQGQNFCTKCGTPVEDGSSTNSGMARIIGSTSGSTKNSSGDLVSIILEVIKKPLSSISNIDKFNQTMALILAGAMLIIGAVSSAVVLFRGSLGLVNLLGSLASVGYATVVLTSIIGQIISFALMSLVVWLFVKDVRVGEINYVKSFEIVMYALIPKVVISAICIIVNLLYVPLGSKLIALSGIFAAILLYKILRYKKLAEPDKALLIVLVTMIF